MKILVINAGSSSLKYQLIDMDDGSVIAKGLVERIGIEGSKLTHKYGNKQEFELTTPLADHTAAMGVVLEALVDPEHGVIQSIDEIGAVGHRVLHGGEEFTASCLVTDEVIAAIKKYIPLGPLHNPANLMGIQACQAVMPNTPMVAVFDTAFHQTMPPKAFMYGVPKKYYDELRIRRYGFHGTSHRYVSGRAIEYLGIPAEGSKIIVCHLGNGSSLSAVVDGKCVDTSMGLTPLEGVLMGTRAGNIDTAVAQYIMQNTPGMTIEQCMDVLNKKSGLLGISGVSSDMRDVMSAAAEGNKDCQLAFEMWAYGIRKYIGAYDAAMGGVDAIVFTAGIGENDAVARAAVCDGLEFMGVKLNKEFNATIRSKEATISAEDSKVKVLVIPTNEELAIAKDTLEIVSK